MAAGSSGLITISGIDDPVALDLQGTIEVSLSNCGSDGECMATISALQIDASPFTVQGTHVAILTLTSQNTTQGVLSGNALAFPNFSGQVNAQLTDGKYDSATVSTGAILARWDAAQDKFVMAFSFEWSPDGGATTVQLDGTAFGTFFNTAPVARIAVSSPSSSISDGVATVECDSPSGTDVVLDASGTTDHEDPHPKVAWYVAGSRVSEAEQLTLSALPVGTSGATLMAYDSSGFAGEEKLAVSVVDTLGPDLTVGDVCAFPPDHKDVCFMLGRELAVSAVDRCDGDVSASAKIVAVSGTATITSWDDEKVCMSVDRSGNGPDVVEEITVAVADSRDNVTKRTSTITVPHDQRGHLSCLRTQPMGAR